MIAQNLYNPTPMAANATLNLTNVNGVASFLCTAAGTLTLTIDGIALPAITVAANTVYPLNYAGRTITAVLAGTAAGILAYC